MPMFNLRKPNNDTRNKKLIKLSKAPAYITLFRPCSYNFPQKVSTIGKCHFTRRKIKKTSHSYYQNHKLYRVHPDRSQFPERSHNQYVILEPTAAYQFKTEAMLPASPTIAINTDQNSHLTKSSPHFLPFQFQCHALILKLHPLIFHPQLFQFTVPFLTKSLPLETLFLQF